MTMPTTSLVAVYGTLKKGYRNYDLFLPGREPLFRGFVRVPFVLYGTPEYPMLVPAEDGAQHSIAIEVFEVDGPKLAELDALEEPYEYWRETVFLKELGKSAEIYVHVAPPPDGFELVRSGEWTG